MALQTNVFFFLNSTGLLEHKHILFYYCTDCMLLQYRRSGLRQAIKTYKMPIRKHKIKGSNVYEYKNGGVAVALAFGTGPLKGKKVPQCLHIYEKN
jgi:hypothetical protein